MTLTAAGLVPHAVLHVVKPSAAGADGFGRGDQAMVEARERARQQEREAALHLKRVCWVIQSLLACDGPHRLGTALWLAL